MNSSNGRVDAIVETEHCIYIIEFKLDKSVALALEQIEEKGYANPYQNSQKRVVALGINFSSQEKQINEWKEVELFTRC